MDLRREIIIMCTLIHTAQTTTPNLRIVDGAAENAAHRERRENEVDKMEKIHRYSMAHTDQNYTKQTKIKKIKKKKGFT